MQATRSPPASGSWTGDDGPAAGNLSSRAMVLAMGMVPIGCERRSQLPDTSPTYLRRRVAVNMLPDLRKPRYWPMTRSPQPSPLRTVPAIQIHRRRLTMAAGPRSMLPWCHAAMLRCAAALLLVTNETHHANCCIRLTSERPAGMRMLAHVCRNRLPGVAPASHEWKNSGYS
ncbi:hypothetical protein CC78DRAFT_574925 [Lojkania enalia]|uniref:Uncharacterized protein n=1 Tax=Lojkania enalia TaxID=147567 RepID=A0A9P4TQD3_9PLEO|nr:hypothetical protein CC78DRAFT_574925 [Didymosphaeria enalia]